MRAEHLTTARERTTALALDVLEHDCLRTVVPFMVVVAVEQLRDDELLPGVRSRSPLLPDPIPRKTKLRSENRISSNATPGCYDAASIRSSSVSAPALSSGSFRLPHFGLWTHDGQPRSHGHPRSSRAVSAAQPSNTSKPRSVMPTPPECPS